MWSLSVIFCVLKLYVFDHVFLGCFTSSVVSLTMVRSNLQHAAGFLSEERRLNAALTRATAGMIIVGNAGFWKGTTQALYNLVEHCERHGCIIGDEIRIPGASSAQAVTSISAKESVRQDNIRQMYRVAALALASDDLDELRASARTALRTLMADIDFQPLLHYEFQLPYHIHALDKRPYALPDWDIKTWSHLCNLTALDMRKDPGNDIYGMGLMLLVHRLARPPESWKLLAHYEFQNVDVIANMSKTEFQGWTVLAGDTLEALGALVS